MKLIAKSGGKSVATFDLKEGASLTVGASPEADCQVSGEPFLSRIHAILQIGSKRVQVERRKGATNPVLFKGQTNDKFQMGRDEHFVIGSTQFHLRIEQPGGVLQGAGSMPAPSYEFTLATDELRAKDDRQDRLRLLDLMELPEVLRTKTRQDFYVYACGLLRLTTGAEWVRVLTSEDGEHTLLAEDAATDRAGDKPMSQSLIDEAVREGPSPVTHAWNQELDKSLDATAHEGVDWAISCAMPVPGETSIVLYLAGAIDSAGHHGGFEAASNTETFLRDNARLVGLVADMIGRAMSLQKVEAWQSRLGRFFSGKLVSKILEAEGSDELAPRIAEATVMFFDIRGFSLLTEGNLERILEYESDLRRVLTAVTQSVYDAEGVVLRYMGDGVLACWNVPYELENHATRAAFAALEMVERMVEVTDGWACGIGLGVGKVVAGSLGSDQIYAYDILGAVANQTARVEGITKVVGVPVLVTDELASRLAPDGILTRRVARFRPAGMEHELDLHTIERVPDDADQRAAVQKRLEIHATGLAAFEAGEWEKAFDLLHPIVQDDPAARYVYKLALQGKPPRDFKGVVELSAK